MLTGVLVYEAILRIINQDYEIEADIMLITAAVGVAVNLLLVICLVGRGGIVSQPFYMCMYLEQYLLEDRSHVWLEALP